MQGVEETHQCHAEACRIQQGGALPHDAADGQNTAGDDAVHRSRQHHRADHVPFAGTQRQRPLPVGLGDGLQALLRGADDGGQDHHHQRQAAGQNSRLKAQLLHEQHHAHQSEDDGGNTGQGLGGEFDDADQPPAGGILRQVDGGTHAQRQHHHHGHKNDIQRIQ